MTTVNTDMDILLLDDDTFQLKTLTHQLKTQGYGSITSFLEGQAALDRLKEEKMANSLIFLDLNMPAMDGVEFMMSLKDTPFNGNIILMSGEDARILESSVRLAEAYEFNVLGHLQKPIDQSRLESLLDKIVGFGNPKKSAGIKSKRTIDAETIWKALENQEFFNVYQPKVDLATGELVGVESLVRWMRPDGETIYPDQFIPLVEEFGMIDDLLWIVLKLALQDQKRWEQLGLETKVAVNISMDNLTSRNFINQVENVLNEAGSSPDRLMLEITESRLMREFSMILNILTRLRLRRFNLSIDDFGTGHSSMLQLRDIPFTELKLDRSYVHNSSKDKTLYALLDGSMKIAKDLGIRTVAEGIEDIDDWNCVRDLECDFAQGYFIGKPMPADTLMAWQEEWIQNSFLPTR